MTYPAHVVSTLVASPSDVSEERKALREAMWDFNDEHTAATEVVLLPITWERSSTPDLGRAPQEILDEQIVDGADIVVGVFWTRIGQLLADGTPATVHELERHVAKKKPALLYFSNRPVEPSSIDNEQFEAVRRFKERAREWGLYGEFANLEELVTKVRRDLLRTVRDRLNLPQVQAPSPALGAISGARPLARVVKEQKSSVDSKQRVKIQNHTYLVVINEGDEVARNVTLAWDPANESEDSGDQPPLVHGMEETLEYLVPKGDVKLPVLVSFGTAQSATLLLKWSDGLGDHEQRQSIRF